MDEKTILRDTRLHETTAANTFRLNDSPPVFVRGSGAFLYTETGAPFLDLVCGSATTCLGHGHPAHKAAINDVLATGIFHTGTRLPSAFRASLYKQLVAILPEGMDTILLANSGAEANEAALKAAQFATGRRRLITFAGGYHGRTLGALSVTDGQRITLPFSLLPAVDRLPYPMTVKETAPVLELIESVLTRRALENDPVAALIIEAVQGVAGVVEPPAAFLRGLRDLSKRFAALLIMDEVWNGFGRAGYMFGFERSGVVPDLVTLGKGLSGGLPLSAVAAPADILKKWPPGMHTSTFQGNPMACAMAVATIDTLREDRLVERVRNVIEPALEEGLKQIVGRGIGRYRVAGAQAALDLIDQKGEPDGVRVADVQRAAMDRGLLLYAGGSGNGSLMILPPLVIEETDLRQAMTTIAKLIDET